MFKFQGIWFPDGEAHFPDWMKKNGELVDGRGTYQIKKLRESMKWCKQFRTAIDVGGHVGLWSRILKDKFNAVSAFEPVATFRDCFVENVLLDGKGTVYVHNCALGAQAGSVSMNTPALGGGIDSGGTHVVPGDEVEMRTLDSFGFTEVDFIKIDCEGYELEVLKGAEQTLREQRPCVIVEQKPRKLGPNFGIKGTPAVDFLKQLGAVVRREMSGDYILSWD